MKKIAGICAIALLSLQASAQQRHLRLNFDEGKSYIQANVRGQFWARYAHLNPGSTLNGEPASHSMDFSMRRLRLGIQSKIGEKFYIFTQVGGNNINQNTINNFRVQLIDLHADYTFSPAFALGVGKSSWGASSRMSSFSNGNLLNLDAGVFSLFTLNKQDDLGRSLGIYAKGKIGKWDYRVALSVPAFNKTTRASESKVDYAVNNPKKRISGYLKYEFWDKESNLNPFSGAAGTYLGAKNILSIGVGGAYQPEMMQKGIAPNLQYFDYKNLSADVFMEKKISERGDALTTYLGYYYTDFGEDYVRYVGANDIAEGGTSLNGKGVQEPTMGTGSSLYWNLGYLLPQSPHRTLRIQPNVGVRYANYKGLKDAAVSYNAGVNLYFNGQASKLSLGYANRPVFDAVSKEVSERKDMIVLQYQFEIR
uniref:porin n=1 Tax=Ornithobacterium rhinotracheale TaxID=28251 RepID=UPI0039A4E108